MRLIPVLIVAFSVLIATPSHAADEEELLKAAAKGDPAKVQELLKGGADVNAEGPNGWTPLDIASEAGHGTVVEALLAKRADVKLKDAKGNTALDYAKQKGHQEIVQMLIAPNPKKQ